MRSVLPQLAVLALPVLSLLSAFAIVVSTHECRGLYAHLQQLEAHRWYLDEEYSRLLLEQSTLGSHRRIASTAAERLEMHAPALSHIRVLRR